MISYFHVHFDQDQDQQQQQQQQQQQRPQRLCSSHFPFKKLQQWGRGDGKGSAMNSRCWPGYEPLETAVTGWSWAMMGRMMLGGHEHVESCVSLVSSLSFGIRLIRILGKV